MSVYQPTYIRGMQTGLVQNRQEFILPDDAYPTLENMFIFREQIRRRQGYRLLGRLRRIFSGSSLGNSGASPWTFNIYSTLVPPITPESTAEIEPGSVVITIQALPDIIFTDQGDGTLTSPTIGNSGTINYLTGDVTLIHTAGAGVSTLINFGYFPGLPVMGLRSREQNNINDEQLIAWDQVYAYKFTSAWEEFIPGTTWSGTDSDFFWTTNYWVTPAGTNSKLFWATNFSGSTGDPIRYTDGTAWVDFSPTIDAVGNKLTQCLALLAFRGRLIAFNTLEGANLAGSISFPQRIRWSAIGNPISDVSVLFPNPGDVNANAWRDDIRGQGGFLNIPTSEDIISVGFVRDNLVIYCERSTWQLRYTGRSISPFQIEKINSELGSESTFSAIQFDTSLVGIGDKGIVECDSFQSRRIDIKIPDLVFQFTNINNGTKRVQGIRDFQQKLAYWIYPFAPGSGVSTIYPNRRLVYNYENDSWAIFTDSLTSLGTYQDQNSMTWQESTFSWEEADFPWVSTPALFPAIIGGNQQGFVELLSSNLQPKVSNDISLSITGITGNSTTATSLQVTNHNLQTDQVIEISDIPTGTAFSSSLNGNKFGIQIIDANNFLLFKYNPSNGQFDIPQLDSPGTYIGGGKIAIRDGFSIISKKFNFLEDGQNIQLGFIDLLINNTDQGAISLNVYLDYNDSTPVNILPQNINPENLQPDTFFNSIVPTTSDGGLVTSKSWKRVFCPVRGAFITIEWTLSNAQLVGPEQESDVQIDSQILWMRKAGRQLPIGV